MKTFAFSIVCIAHPLLILCKTNAMASQSQQWKDIQISKERHRKTENVVDIHLKDIDNARPIVSFRELTYQWIFWWIVTVSCLDGAYYIPRSILGLALGWVLLLWVIRG